MVRFFIFIFGLILLILGLYLFFNPEQNFEAKFKNVDGLPKGAPVTALGVKIGEVARTKALAEGIIVTVRLTNPSVAKPPPGSQITITSFRPGQGRVLEVIFPESVVNKDSGIIVEEPVTNESWLEASIELLDNLKDFSGFVVKKVTPENIQNIKGVLSKTSDSVTQTAARLEKHTEALGKLKKNIDANASEANKLLGKLSAPVSSLNSEINDKSKVTALKKDVNYFASKLSNISRKVSLPEFPANIRLIKNDVLNYLKEVNTSLTENSLELNNPELPAKINEFNKNLGNLNAIYEKVNTAELGKSIKEKAEKGKDFAVKIEEKTSKFK